MERVTKAFLYLNHSSFQDKKKMILACLTQFKPKLKELIHRNLILPLSLWIKIDMIKSKT
jgi:hypothetical protein